MQNTRKLGRYALDETFRSSVRSRGRIKRGTRASVNWRSLYAKLSKLVKFAPERKVVTSCEGVESVILVSCFTTAELAKILGRSQRAVEGWRQAGRFPAPTYYWKNSGRSTGVYEASASAAIVKLFADHLRSRSDHYRADHTELCVKLLSV